MAFECKRQCDLMARLLIIDLVIYISQNLPKGIVFLSREGQNVTQILLSPNKVVPVRENMNKSDFPNFEKERKITLRERI